jgi:hypothetical protein
LQSFLPYPSFTESAVVLDYRRLGKMRVEAWQLLRANLGVTKGWVNHPAAVMYRGYEAALCRYGLAMCDEWIGRGYNDTMRARFIDAIAEIEDTGNPPWLGDEAFHRSHQSNLIRKNPEHYRPIFGDDVPDNLEYVWPTT